MLDLSLFRQGTVRGAAIAQIGTSVAMAGVMFTLILHFQYAWGWSPLQAGLANLPLIATMILATPLTEWLVRRCGHRIACLIGAGLLAAGLGLMAWAVQQDYLAIAIAMVVMTAGLRTVMTICAVALVGAMPENRTSMGAAMNDTAQELGTSVGTAVVGTLIAALVTVSLPAGAWAPALVASFFHGEQVVFIVLAVAVGVISGVGALTLTDARTVDEHALEEQEHEPAV
jgi:fucose permease